MNLTFDRNLFMQVGLDSGSLTMLGSVVHTFSEPGDYRCVVHDGPRVLAVFTITVDPQSPEAQATIDLVSLIDAATKPGEPSACCGGAEGKPPQPRRFSVNPRGYVLFRVSRGAGGYYVHARRTTAAEDDKGYDSRALVAGDVYTAIVMRPGSYSVVNTLTGARAELAVAYPKRSEKRYQPPPPLRVACTEQSFEPAGLMIDPGQGLIFECRAPARLQIMLDKPDDGPNVSEPPRPTGRISNRVR